MKRPAAALWLALASCSKASEPAPKPAADAATSTTSASSARDARALLSDDRAVAASSRKGKADSAGARSTQRSELRGRGGSHILLSMRSIALGLAFLLLSCEAAAPAAMPVPLGDSPERGPSDAWVTIVEFSDFQCPACGAAAPTIVQLLSRYPADLRLVYKHFPLTMIHPNARPAAIAAECAREQGRFWEMHDRLFANQRALTSDDLKAYASAIGLDIAKWESCLSNPGPAARVDADEALGEKLGVRATPTFVINGKPLEGAAPLATFEQRVESARAEAEASGIARGEYYQRAVLGQ